MPEIRDGDDTPVGRTRLRRKINAIFIHGPGVELKQRIEWATNRSTEQVLSWPSLEDAERTLNGALHEIQKAKFRLRKEEEAKGKK